MREQLAHLGHEGQFLDDRTIFVGGSQGLMIAPQSGAYMAGADPRHDGYALAYCPRPVSREKADRAGFQGTATSTADGRVEYRAVG